MRGRATGEDRVEAARELVLAIFRLAVCDYLGLSYGHDAPDRPRQIRADHRSEAAFFLRGTWAAHLAEQAGFRAELVWREAQRIARVGASSEQRRAA